MRRCVDGDRIPTVVTLEREAYVFELPGTGSVLNFNTHEVSLAVSLTELSSHNSSSTGF